MTEYPDRPGSPAGQRPFRLRSVLCASLFGIVTLAALGWTITRVRSQRDAERRMVCESNLATIAVYMSKYCADHGHLPPAYIADTDGKPMHSWRVLLLESIDPALYQSYYFDEPWNGPRNRKLADRMPRCYACPNDGARGLINRTSYAVVVGRATAFPGSKSVTPIDIQNDKSQTILVAEVAESDIHWMEPRDLLFDEMSFRLNDPSRPSISSHDRTGPGVILADGSRDRLGKSISPVKLKAMATVSKGDK